MTDPTPVNLTPPVSEKRKRRWLWPVATLLALFAGVGIGGASAEPATAEPKVRTVTETETVEATPVVCLTALNEADALMTIAGEFAQHTSTAMGISADAVMAAGSFDVAGLTDATERLGVVNGDLGALTDQVSATTYPELRDACRLLAE